MAINKIMGWRTSDGNVFDSEERALWYETKVEVEKAVDNCTYCGEFCFGDFLRTIKNDKDLVIKLKFLVS